MKTLLVTHPNSRLLRGAVQAAALFTGATLMFAAEPQVVSSTAAAKDHVLFVGTDFAVKEGNDFYRVVGAKRDSLQIEKGHRSAYVRLGQGVNIKVSRGVKLSNLSATISEVKTESVDRASARAQLAAMQASMALSDAAGDQGDRLHGTMTVLSAVAINPEAGSGAAISRANLDAIQASASASYISALPAIEQSTTAASTLLVQNLRPTPIDDELTLDASALPGLKLPDGSDVGGSAFESSPTATFMKANAPSGTSEVELTFNVSSPIALENAYIVVVANYGSASKPEESARQISTKEFGRVDSHPRRVKMTHSASVNGLPFRKFEMGLYANGQEVATNLSEKRLSLTPDQAYQFFLIDYLGNHRGATRPPTPILMAPRTEFRRDVENAASDQTIYANVDKSGHLLSLSADASGNQNVSAAVEKALRNIRFMPALNNGAPVDGRAKMTLAQLAN